MTCLRSGLGPGVPVGEGFWRVLEGSGGFGGFWKVFWRVLMVWEGFWRVLERLERLRAGKRQL